MLRTTPLSSPNDSATNDSAPNLRRSTAGDGRPQPARLRMRDVARGEWIKFWSVRSMWVTLLAAGAATVGFGMIFSAIAGTDAQASSPAGGLTGPVDVALGGVFFPEMMIGVLGVLMAAGEYSTGVIRTAFAAVGRRRRVVLGKVGVLSGSVFAVATLAAFVTLLAGQAVYAGAEPTVPITELVGVIVGTGVYLTGVALIGLALGFMLRSTAGGIATMVGAVFLGPRLLNLLPASLTDVFMKFLPSEAGSAMMTNVANPDLLSPGAAYAVLAAWVVGLLAAAALLVERRDA